MKGNKLQMWQVDAFSAKRFGGNPAAVVPLKEWLPDAQLAAIAAENNLAETAFFVPHGEDYAIRWFTPTVEVPLCGHATLASAWVVLNALNPKAPGVRFHSQSGPLTVARRADGKLEMDFPVIPLEGKVRHPLIEDALGHAPLELHRSMQWVAVYKTEDEVRRLAPDFAAMRRIDIFGVIATAPGKDCDFVSRFFAPGAGIDEDPVTGSAHCRLVPYWAAKLGKTELFARQVSPRGGELWCRLDGDRVKLAGDAALYLEGTIHV